MERFGCSQLGNGVPAILTPPIPIFSLALKGQSYSGQHKFPVHPNLQSDTHLRRYPS
ncbi:hypothetical protein HanXRQr2_Chr08g0345451 [Helianthus annuus]|uniref:Uncharacterized protein n=1 Tax=Helianthus annuus TaxID=4232 RepID=A0A9K3IG53_HELAN|nr:hypothetical protein HanXRQr2_Chr08g0345451 [Helianthus annuus]KAJ0902169.1 hypothetical protein HanPSC8_Chr08g0333861 [Helianthus annuus]